MTCIITVCILSSHAYRIVEASSVNPKNNKPSGIIAKETYDIIMANADMLDSAIIYERDFQYN
jgi:hypothetical protein